MSTVLTDETRVARKRYRCWYCDELIAIGEKHGYRSGISEGDFYTMRHHPECDKFAIENWDSDGWEYHDPCEFQRPTTT